MANVKSKDKKLRRKQNQEENVKKENKTFDVLFLLQDSDLSSKPKMGEFLKEYMKSIRVMVQHSKVMIYPVQRFDIGKVFIDFLDGHQIVSDFSKSEREYFLYHGIEEIDLKEKERKLVIMFVQKLQEFSFIHN